MADRAAGVAERAVRDAGHKGRQQREQGQHIKKIKQQAHAPERHEPLRELRVTDPCEIHTPCGEAMWMRRGGLVRRATNCVPCDECDAKAEKKGLPTFMTHRLKREEKLHHAPPQRRI